MKLLICTQAIDKNHPILGFFHRWVEEFAKHCEVVHVICLQEGEHSLPANVHVHSLGKESGQNRLKYLWRFYRLIWKLRHEYDSVFVHMNQVYVLLGALLWRSQGKRVGLWYMHGTVSTSLRVAEKLVHVIFTGSKESFRLPSLKLIITGHGIDTERFRPVVTAKDIDLITVGRITPSKNISLLLEALGVIRTSQAVTLTIVGKAVTPEEVVHEHELRTKAAALGVGDAVVWYGAAPNSAMPDLLNRSRVFVHAATNGSLDKAVLEAMACGIPVVSCADGVRSLTGISQIDATKEALASAVSFHFKSSEVGLVLTQHTYVSKNHSILSLIPTLLNHLY